MSQESQIAILNKLSEITEAAIGWADAVEEECEANEWNTTHKPSEQRSTVSARVRAGRLAQDLRIRVKELHAL